MGNRTWILDTGIGLTVTIERLPDLDDPEEYPKTIFGGFLIKLKLEGDYEFNEMNILPTDETHEIWLSTEKWRPKEEVNGANGV